MESDKVLRLLDELRQLVDRWELELGARPVWWRRHAAVRTNDPRKKSEMSAASPRASAKLRNGSKRPNSPGIGAAPRRAAVAAADARRVAGK
jgi:hypothetical protein